MSGGLRLAVGTLTTIPVGDLGVPDRRTGRDAMLLAPIAALPLGLLAALVVAAGTALRLPDAVIGTLVVAALAVATRGMHLDGLADTVDGFGAGWTRERALEVMRRGDVGPMGAAALVLTLLCQVAAIDALLVVRQSWLVVGAAVVVSRTACPLLCAKGVPAARPDGLGAVVADTVPAPFVVGWVLAGAGIMTAATHVAGDSLLRGAVAVLLATMALLWLARSARRTFGGVTGDVIGGGIELHWTVLLIGLTLGVVS
ncbi:adenosylcobinamide-GDP ribazoletransferase [Janibacter sp. G1551]|uniref:adenosylcobinamide-GDP ribazoletransferase n=1 Tax=Janibacter sp. G1551 TaxID=3420440 RepID=UPI003CFD836F